MKILTCTRDEFLGLTSVGEYDYIIFINAECWVGHKCIKPSRYPMLGYGNLKYFRWHYTKHCKICHKTWPKEVQVTANMV